MGKSFSTLVMVAVGIAAVFIFGRYLADNHAFPTLSEYIASTTPATLAIRAPQGVVNAIVAETPGALTQGLSGRESLGNGEGMLFLFPVAEKYGFWMKDMDFPLDIVWIDAEKTVIGIAKGIATSTYPDNFFPPSPVSSVLELNAGEAEQFGIATGTILVF